MQTQRLLGLAFVAALSGCVDATLTIVNDSSYVIQEVYLTDVGSSTWGSNLLRGDVLLPGEEFTLGVSCGDYDALLVDDTNVDCEVLNLDLCLNDSEWIIQNNTCTVFNAAPEQIDRANAEASKN